MEQLNKEMVIASLMPELTRHGYQQLFADCSNSVLTKQTLQGSYDIAWKLRLVYDALLKRKEIEDKPQKDIIKCRKDGYDTYLKPIKELLDYLEPLFIEINNEILAGERERQNLIDEENAVKQKHIVFVNDTIKDISSASDNKTLVNIQKIVGLELTRKEYNSYEPIKTSCKLLLSLIEDRKTIIKEDAVLEKAYQKAMSDNDLPMATEIREQIDAHKKLIEENALIIAEDAYKQVSAVSIVKSDTVSMAISPRTHRWSYRIDNTALLQKKHPELFELVLNEKAATEFMNSRKEDLDKEEEHYFDGITLYYKPYFVKPSK